MIKWMLFVVLVVSVLTSGCGKKETPKMPAASPSAEQTAQAPSKDTVEDYIPDTGAYGTVTQCPVMIEKITVDKDTKAVKYKGKIYYLCCPSCTAQFKQNPDKYAK